MLGASTLEGTRVREAWKPHASRRKKVDLYGHSEGEVLLSEYAGEARMIQEPDPLEIAARTRPCSFANAAKAPNAVAAIGSAEDQVVIDLVGGTSRQARERDSFSPAERARKSGAGFYAVPHPAGADALGSAPSPIDRGPGDRTSALRSCVRPAVDYGEAGVEELRQQTVRLLNFVEIAGGNVRTPTCLQYRPRARAVLFGSRVSNSEIARQVADACSVGIGSA